MTNKITSNISVSVVVAAKNEAKHLNQSLISILNQGGLSFEVIYVDDHSEDKSLTIALDISETYQSLSVCKNPKHGKCSAYNYGVSLARGRFICIFAGDDIMPAGSLLERYEAIKNESDDDSVVGLSKLITMSEVKKFDGHLIPRAKNKGALSGVSPLMNRKAADLIFPTPEQLPNEDNWMELIILHMPQWRIIHSNTICCQWRVHSGNSINMLMPFNEYNKRITARMEALFLFAEKFSPKLDQENLRIIQCKIELEQARRNGNWIQIILGQGSFVDRLRAISVSNKFMFELRRIFYGLLSGW